MEVYSRVPARDRIQLSSEHTSLFFHWTVFPVPSHAIVYYSHQRKVKLKNVQQRAGGGLTRVGFLNAEERSIDMAIHEREKQCEVSIEGL